MTTARELRYEVGANGQRFMRSNDLDFVERVASKLLDREGGVAYILDRTTGDRTDITAHRRIERRLVRA